MISQMNLQRSTQNRQKSSQRSTNRDSKIQNHNKYLISSLPYCSILFLHLWLCSPHKISVFGFEDVLFPFPQNTDELFLHIFKTGVVVDHDN